MKRVVIIGGGFAGSKAAMALEKNFDTILIDNKDYFEFTPSILKIPARPDYIRKIRIKHSEYLKKTQIIVSEVKDLTRNYVATKSLKIPYDYLIISSGSYYGLKVGKESFFNTGTGKDILNSLKHLKKANDILIVGGGLVGVELAAELSGKNITMIHSKSTLLERNHPKSISIADKFLRKKGTKIITQDRAILEKKQLIRTENKLNIKADLVYICTGISPNIDFMKKNFSRSIGKDGIKVNRFLQIEGHDNIFAIGDVNSIKEEKTAQSAVEQGNLASMNIISLEKGISLKEYRSRRRPMVISLGEYNGIFEYKKIIFSGIIPIFMKKLIEIKALFPYKIRKYL